ncbi:MAG: hypothetical protein DWQ08_00345 [Proteobacteria bacterium]|nr:MAG: hypothetical protein DWQ08_00345 [Pseudomonadota bacterium]
MRGGVSQCWKWRSGGDSVAVRALTAVEKGIIGPLCREERIVILKDLAGAVSSALPSRFSEDIRKNVRAAVRAAIENMELVSREEFEVQQQVLSRTRQKVEALETRVAELERRVGGEKGTEV